MVADKVTVVSKKRGEEAAFSWESDGIGSYTVSDATRDGFGTSITLHLRDGQDDYLNEWRIRDLVKSYSDFIAYPIFFEELGKKEEPKKEEVYKKAEDATASVKTIHTVRWYEDLTVIAGKYGVSEESIMAANKLADKKLKNRQKLIIPNTEAVVSHVVQTEADVQEEEEITDLETAFDQPSEEYTPVFAAPKNKDVKAVVLLPLKATGTTGSRSNMDFYSGMLLAARELGEEGVNLEMDVYDIASGTLGATRSELEDCDLVIGPVSADDISRIYSSAPGIKALISPLDPRAENILSSHPTMIHAPSSRNMQYRDLVQWIREDMQEGDKVIIISE
jgi:LysM repeat protein